MAVDAETQKLIDSAAKARAEASALEASCTESERHPCTYMHANLCLHHRQAEYEKTRPARPKPEIVAAPKAAPPAKPAAPPRISISAGDLAARIGDLSLESAEAAISTLSKLREEGLCTRSAAACWTAMCNTPDSPTALCRFDCADLGEPSNVTQGQLKQQTGIDGKASHTCLSPLFLDFDIHKCYFNHVNQSMRKHDKAESKTMICLQNH